MESGIDGSILAKAFQFLRGISIGSIIGSSMFLILTLDNILINSEKEQGRWTQYKLYKYYRSMTLRDDHDEPADDLTISLDLIIIY